MVLVVIIMMAIYDINKDAAMMMLVMKKKLQNMSLYTFIKMLTYFLHPQVNVLPAQAVVVSYVS